MSSLADIQSDVAAISAQLDLIVALVTGLRSSQGVVTQPQLDDLAAAISTLKDKTVAIQ